MSNKILPLVYFSHAELKSRDNLNASLEVVTEPTSHIRPKSAFDSSRLRKQRIRLAIDDLDMNYEALEEDEQPFVIAGVDKATHAVVVYNTPCFNMKPKCYLSSAVDLAADATLLNVNPGASYSEKLDSLTAAFGSSKKRKAMQTKLRNKLDTETLENAVSAAVSESQRNGHNGADGANGASEADGENGQLEQFSVMPTPNREAKSPLDVYDLHELLALTPAEFERATLDQSAKFAMADAATIKKWQATGGGIYADYVIEHLAAYSAATFGHQYKLAKCKQLAYMHYLLSLYRLRANQLRTKAPLGACEVPDAAIGRLFEAYTCVSTANAYAKSVRSMPRRLKDKLTCHILVLALHIDDFSTCVDTFQRDLRLSVQRLGDFFQALGCHVKARVATVNGKRLATKWATLALPLNDVNKHEAKKRQRKS